MDIITLTSVALAIGALFQIVSLIGLTLRFVQIKKQLAEF